MDTVMMIIAGGIIGYLTYRHTKHVEEIRDLLEEIKEHLEDK